MHVHEIKDKFGLDNLVKAERPRPSCGPGQVLIHMKAVSLNYRDLLMANGLYNPRQRLPLIPASDGVGEVVKVGEGVVRWQPGQRVMPIFAQEWVSGVAHRAAARSTLGGPRDGLLAEWVCLSEQGLVAVPDHLSDVEAATLPCAAVTAWNALHSGAGIRPGQTVLVQGTGGVSIFALQLARLAGARVIVTSSSDAKLERAKQLGAKGLINYRTNPEWGKQAHEMAEGEGVDLVIDVGGAGTLDQSIRAVRVGGRIALIGILAGRQKELDLAAIFMRAITLQGILVGNRDDFEAMNRAIELHRVRPVVDRVFPFDQVREAFLYVASGVHFGKVCIQVDSPL